MNVFSYYGANHLTYGRMGGGEGAVEGLDFYVPLVFHYI